MTVRQHSFYLEDDDWVALRHYCLDRGISVSSFIAQTARDAVDDIRKGERAAKTAKALELNGETRSLGIAGIIAESHMDGDVRVIDKVDIQSVSAAAVLTGTGQPATIPVNPVRAVPKPERKAKPKARVTAS